MDSVRLRAQIDDVHTKAHQTVDRLAQLSGNAFDYVAEALVELLEHFETQARQDDHDKGPVADKPATTYTNGKGWKFTLPHHLAVERSYEEKLDFILTHGDIEVGTGTWNSLKYDTGVRTMVLRDSHQWIDDSYTKAYKAELARYQDSEW